jgi:hypothetical protein
MGAILVSQFRPVKIHSYLSPADGLQVNTQMIEGPNAVVIFDGQLLLPYADEVASGAARPEASGLSTSAVGFQMGQGRVLLPLPSKRTAGELPQVISPIVS